MSLRNSNGAHLFGQFGRVCPRLGYGPRSRSHSASSPGPFPSALHRHQRRVLRTSTKASPLPLHSANSLLNWSYTPHRMRHISPSAMTAKTQTRGHAGHHHHAHDNTYLVSTNKKDAGVRITRIGLYVNLGMAIGKGIGGYVFNSQGD